MKTAIVSLFVLACYLSVAVSIDNPHLGFHVAKVVDKLGRAVAHKAAVHHAVYGGHQGGVPLAKFGGGFAGAPFRGGFAAPYGGYQGGSFGGHHAGFDHVKDKLGFRSFDGGFGGPQGPAFGGQAPKDKFGGGFGNPHAGFGGF